MEHIRCRPKSDQKCCAQVCQNVPHCIEPLVTGERFALFKGMMIAHAGQRHPHSQIVVYTGHGGNIVEERYFYD